MEPTTPSHRARSARKSKTPEDGLVGGRGQVAHTLTACCRCRHRKTRCDASLPRCGPCERIDAICEYFDSAKGKNIPRTYVVHLQNRVQHLEQELASAIKEQSKPPETEVLLRGASLVKIPESAEAKFMGPSSGIAMTRLVMELAKFNCHASSIKEIVPEKKAREIKERFEKESSKPTSKIYPLISSVAAPTLPSRELTDRLVQNFNNKAQYLLPVLHEPSFARVVNDVYQGDLDPYKGFAVRLVIAISMQKLDTQYAGLADSYYLAALTFLESAIRPMNLNTLQCFMLIAQYSMVTPTRTASSWIVGLAVRLCQELGLTDEATITCDPSGARLNDLEIDMRRRLLWVTLSMECGLAHSLGRPSAFAISHDHVDVEFFALVDDQFITSHGILPGSPPSRKKHIAMHFIKMRMLQLEIRRTLYLKKTPTPRSDQDPWFVQMEAKLKNWVSTGPRNDEGSGANEDWFKVRYNTIVVFLFRPSPQVPHPSIRAARLCFEASRFNIYAQREQIRTKSVDISWVFCQSLFMALNTVLWALSYPDIRLENPKEDVENHLHEAQEAIYLASLKWPGVTSALELYQTLSAACLKAYDSYGSPAFTNASPVNAAVSPYRGPVSPPINFRDTPERGSPGYVGGNELQLQLSNQPDSPENSSSWREFSRQSTVSSPASTSQQTLFGDESSSHDSLADPTMYNNPLPGPTEYGIGPPIFHENQEYPIYDQNIFLGPQYLNFLHAQHAPQAPAVQGLSLEEQSDLLEFLEEGLRGNKLPSPEFFNSSGWKQKLRSFT